MNFKKDPKDLFLFYEDLVKNLIDQLKNNHTGVIIGKLND